MSGQNLCRPHTPPPRAGPVEAGAEGCDDGEEVVGEVSTEVGIPLVLLEPAAVEDNDAASASGEDELEEVVGHATEPVSVGDVEGGPAEGAPEDAAQEVDEPAPAKVDAAPDVAVDHRVRKSILRPEVRLLSVKGRRLLAGGHAAVDDANGGLGRRGCRWWLFVSTVSRAESGDVVEASTEGSTRPEAGDASGIGPLAERLPVHLKGLLGLFAGDPRGHERRGLNGWMCCLLYVCAQPIP